MSRNKIGMNVIPRNHALPKNQKKLETPSKFTQNTGEAEQKNEVPIYAPMPTDVEGGRSFKQIGTINFGAIQFLPAGTIAKIEQEENPLTKSIQQQTSPSLSLSSVFFTPIRFAKKVFLAFTPPIISSLLGVKE